MSKDLSSNLENSSSSKKVTFNWGNTSTKDNRNVGWAVLILKIPAVLVLRTRVVVGGVLSRVGLLLAEVHLIWVLHHVGDTPP